MCILEILGSTPSFNLAHRLRQLIRSPDSQLAKAVSLLHALPGRVICGLILWVYNLLHTPQRRVREQPQQQLVKFEIQSLYSLLNQIQLIVESVGPQLCT